MATWNDFPECAEGIRSVKVQAAPPRHAGTAAPVQGVPEAQALREKAGRLSA